MSLQLQKYVHEVYVLLLASAIMIYGCEKNEEELVDRTVLFVPTALISNHVLFFDAAAALYVIVVVVVIYGSSTDLV